MQLVKTSQIQTKIKLTTTNIWGSITQQLPLEK